MKYLTKRAEELLKEILEHRLSNGNCDTEYWKERFESLSVADAGTWKVRTGQLLCKKHKRT